MISNWQGIMHSNGISAAFFGSPASVLFWFLILSGRCKRSSLFEKDGEVGKSSYLKDSTSFPSKVSIFPKIGICDDVL